MIRTSFCSTSGTGMRWRSRRTARRRTSRRLWRDGSCRFWCDENAASLHMSARNHPGESAAPGAWILLRLWSGIGLKSFGGGASTQLLIRRTFVDERGWIGDAELAHLWNLCQFTPGINLISLTILIGRKLGGTRGIIVSMLGMLLPSAIVTCCLTAGFEAFRH